MAAERETPYWDYQDVLIFAALALPCLILAGLLTRAALGSFPASISNDFMRSLIGQFVGYGFWFTALYALLKWKYDRPFWRGLAWIPPRTGIWSLVAGPLLAFGCATLGIILKTPQIHTRFEDMMADRTSIILLGVFMTTLGPMFEELAFRGFLLPLLIHSFGPVPGVLLAAVPFALLHGPQYSWSWQHVTLIVVAGCIFGWTRYKTRSTFAAAVVHATYNLTFFLPVLLQSEMDSHK